MTRLTHDELLKDHAYYRAGLHVQEAIYALQAACNYEIASDIKEEFKQMIGDLLDEVDHFKWARKGIQEKAMERARAGSAPQ